MVHQTLRSPNPTQASVVTLYDAPVPRAAGVALSPGQLPLSRRRRLQLTNLSLLCSLYFLISLSGHTVLAASRSIDGSMC